MSALARFAFFTKKGSSAWPIIFLSTTGAVFRVPDLFAVTVAITFRLTKFTKLNALCQQGMVWRVLNEELPFSSIEAVNPEIPLNFIEICRYPHLI